MAEALDVDGDGGEDVLDVGLGLVSVAAVAHAVAAGERAHGALDAGPDCVALAPGGVLLVGAVAGRYELTPSAPRPPWKRCAPAPPEPHLNPAHWPPATAAPRGKRAV